MKQYIIFLFLFISYDRVFGQTPHYLVPEWGMMKFGDTLLIDETEITCGEYLDFLYYQNLADYKNYLLNRPLDEKEISLLKKVIIETKLLPDQEILDSLPYSWLFKKCENCSTFIFESVVSNATIPISKDSMMTKSQINRVWNLLQLPIVGISFEQANLFCQWRTNRDKLVNRIRYYKKGIIEYDTIGLIYALPSPLEFDLINPSQDSIVNKKGIIANYNHKNATYKLKPDIQNSLCGKTLMTVHSFFRSAKSNVHSTVDMQGNVAEMTSVKGISKGGSYFHYATETIKGKEIIYTKPEKWLGFRCVAKLDKNGY